MASTALRLPWMVVFDREMERSGFAGVFAIQDVPAGSEVWVDEAARKARITYPDGRIAAWLGTAVLQVRPDEPLYEVTWHVPGADPHRIQFRPMDEWCEDATIRETGYELYMERVQGKEDVLWPQFTALALDPLLNPAGCPLPDGTYIHHDIAFRIDFGRHGSRASLLPVADTLPPVLDFPYRSELALHRPVDAGGKTMPAGYYQATVSGFRMAEGEVTSLTCRGKAGVFHISGKVIVGMLHDRSAEILSVIEDHMLHY